MKIYVILPPKVSKITEILAKNINFYKFAEQIYKNLSKFL